MLHCYEELLVGKATEIFDSGICCKRDLPHKAWVAAEGSLRADAKFDRISKNVGVGPSRDELSEVQLARPNISARALGIATASVLSCWPIFISFFQGFFN